MTQSVSPLSGVRVLDLTRVLAGPHCGRMLCDYGAEVIKVEPPEGDLTRFTSPRVGSLSTYFIQQNAGKKCISIDLSTVRGAEIFRGLADASDVVLENYRPGVMDRLGLGYETLSSTNPRLVYASISGYGADGPWVHRRAYASVIGAESGLTRAQGDTRGGNYANDPWSHADTYTALETTTAILAALYQRERTGAGECIDVSMAGTMLYVNEHMHDELYDGPTDPNWIRSFQPGDYPIMQVADGSHVVISAHPAERGTFEIIVAVMDKPDLLNDSRFVDVQTRMSNFEALLHEMRTWAASLATAQDFEDRCDEFGLAVGVMRTARELAENEWAHERGAITTVPDRIGGDIRVPNAPWHFTHGKVGTHGEPRYRGEDNRHVLRNILSLSDEEISSLENDGVISSRIPKTS